MANLLETSFVPQQPLLKVESGRNRPSEPINVALVLSLIIFFVTLAVAGGMYFYKGEISKQVITKGESLTAAEKNFDIDKINEFKTLQTSIGAAKGLVDNHLVFSEVLDMLEGRTAQNIGLTSLSFDAGSDVILGLTGQAPSYAAVYFQNQKWRETTPLVQSSEISSLNLDESSGVVSFGVKIKIDPQQLGYLGSLTKKSILPPPASSVTAIPTGLPAFSSTTP